MTTLKNSFLSGPFHLIKLLSFLYPTNVNWQLDQTRGCCVPPIKKGGGSARFHHSARCASKWRRQISRSCAWRLSRIAKFVFFFKRGAKNFRKPRKCTKKKRATRNRLVYRDDAEGDWASICWHRENTSRRQAKKLQPLRKPHSASV